MKNHSWLKALAFAAAILPLAPSLAQNAAAAPATGQHFGRHGRGGHAKGNGEVRAYVQQNVMPVVRQQRQKLDAQMSAADKTQLATYRTQLKTLREQGKALRQSLKSTTGATPGQRPPLTDAQQQQLQQLRSEQRAVLLNVAQLAQKYDSQIQQLKAEVQPQRAQWEADIKALMLKNATPEQQQKLQQWQDKGGHRGHRGFGGKQKFFGPTRFVLLDPNAPTQPASAAAGSRAALYPNPATATQHLDYDVKKQGNVKVELLDERGKALRTVFEGQQDKGSHALDVNLADLPRGTYYYKITSKGNSETRRFVKE